MTAEVRTGLDDEDRRTSIIGHAALVVGRTTTLAQIPSPTGHEAERAEEVARWWALDGLSDVAIDRAGNVWGRVLAGTGRAVLICAHLDTVFPFEVDHSVRNDGARLWGPGVGDNSVAVAALSSIGMLIREASPSGPVWVLATVAEEGLGNLRGVTWALDHPAEAVGALVALEGNYLGRIGTVGVGSVRWEVEVEGPGGHSWEAASSPSAVDAAARLVVSLGNVAVRPAERSVNVGTFRGGEAINARARHARFVVDLRAAEPDELDHLVMECRRIINSTAPDGLSVAVRDIGSRPAGRIDEDHPLVRAAGTALRAGGRSPTMVAASTDANAALSRGIPAVALGVTIGAGEHTTGEWIEIAPIADGLRAVADTVVNYLCVVHDA